MDDGVLLIAANTTDNEQLRTFLDYFVDEWMNNTSSPTEMWNVQRTRGYNLRQQGGRLSSINKLVILIPCTVRMHAMN